ncbi:hypothetical protein BC827DRAFT_1214156 [Russula dissimulans]|nr:hypothetical protein BC827DRAFT_1214156 [Russula dissimulans]
MSMMPTIIFNGGGGGAGGGGGGSSPSLVSNGSGQNDHYQDTGSGKTNPGQHSMLLTRREHVDMNIAENFSTDKGYITIVPTANIPKRLVLTADCFHPGKAPDNVFTFTVDLLLVPTSFDMQTCYHLYFEPRRGCPFGTRSLRDKVILLRRLAVHGKDAAFAVEHCDVPEDIRKRTDYRLVVTCPAFLFSSSQSDVFLWSLLEMEF